ncbi:hypothetical protein FXW78_48805 [Rhodococcus opacus]|nr:hypothetical protein [Rhodococcus opacus]
MGIERVSLELPADSAAADVQAHAVAQLRAQGIRTWSDLSLQTILATDEPGVTTQIHPRTLPGNARRASHSLVLQPWRSPSGQASPPPPLDQRRYFRVTRPISRAEAKATRCSVRTVAETPVSRVRTRTATSDLTKSTAQKT